MTEINYLALESGDKVCWNQTQCRLYVSWSNGQKSLNLTFSMIRFSSWYRLNIFEWRKILFCKSQPLSWMKVEKQSMPFWLLWSEWRSFGYYDRFRYGSCKIRLRAKGSSGSHSFGIDVHRILELRPFIKSVGLEDPSRACQLFIMS